MYLEMDDLLAKIIVNTDSFVGEIPPEIQARYQVHIPELTPQLILAALQRIRENPTTAVYELAFFRLKTGGYPSSILESKFLRQFQFTVKKMEPWDPESWQKKFDSNEDFCLTKAIYGLDFLRDEFNKKALADM